MGWKRKLKNSFTVASGNALDVGKYVEHMAIKAVDSVGHSVEHAVDRVVHQAHSAIEAKVEHTIEHVQEHIQQEVYKAAPGIMLLGIGITIAAISSFLFSLVVVQVLTEVVQLPSWAAYLVVSTILAAISFVLIQQGRGRLFRNE